MRARNRSRYAILGFLSWGPMSGYDIRKMIEASVGNFWRESYGQIYPILRQLESEGLARCRVEPRDGRPDRKVYSISDAGRRELDAWLASPVDDQPSRNELLLKLFFARRAGTEEAVGLVETFRELQSRLFERYEAIESELRGGHSGDADLPYWLITVRYGRHVSRALLDWCDETLGTLGELRRKEGAASEKG